MTQVVLAEQRDLQQGDIPFFSTRPSSRDVFTSTNERIKDFFDEDSLSVVKRRLAELSEVDLFRQTWFIRASIATLGISKEKGGIQESHDGTQQLFVESESQLVPK